MEIKSFINKYGFTLLEDDAKKIPTRVHTNENFYLLKTLEGIEYLGIYINKSDLDENQLEQLIKEIKALRPPLHTFFCNDSNLTSFKVEEKEFTTLTFLNLSYNSKLTKVEIQNSDSLATVIACDCEQLTEVIVSGRGNSIKKIDVSTCKLQKLSLPTTLPQIREVLIQKNQLTSFEFLTFIKNDTTFDISRLIWFGNAFPETFTNTLRRKDMDALKAFFVEKLVKVFRKKLILLGNTQAGKTSLCDILKNEDLADGTSTHGVNVSRYQLGENRFVQIYDFGGQDFYHNAHLPFYTMNTNYLLVYGNSQEDKYGTVPAYSGAGEDDTFPMSYWLSSVKANLKLAENTTNTLQELKNNNVQLSLLENLTAGIPKRLLNEMELQQKYGVTAFHSFQLRNKDGSKLEPLAQKKIKDTLLQWLDNSLKEDPLPLKIKEWGDKLVKEKWGVVTPKSKFTNLSETDFKLLHDSYALHLCEEFEGKPLPDALKDSVIVNLGTFTKWIYAILNLSLKNEEKGVFNEAKAKAYLEKAHKKATLENDTTFEGATNQKNIEFILAFLKYYKMIFKIEGSGKNYLVPQYLPKPEDHNTTDDVLLKLFDEPFVKYIFTGFYHTQILTAIIANFFERNEKSNIDVEVAKNSIGGVYQYLIWKNKVILYLSNEEKLNPNDFLLVEFKIDEDKNQPMLVLREMGHNSLKKAYHQLKQVIEYIESQLVDYQKLIKTPSGTYISADLLKDDNRFGNGNQSDLIYDKDNKCFYRKGDFPLFFNPKDVLMKKIFISYSKSDEKYKNELKKHFYPLKRQSKIDTFDDSDLGFGEWNPEILRKIEECDIFICLISIDFLNTNYIINTELPHAIKHDKVIIPIKIRECDWHDFGIEDENGEVTSTLGKYNASLKAKTITLFDDKNDYVDKRINTPEERDSVWTNLVQQFKKKALNE